MNPTLAFKLIVQLNSQCICSSLVRIHHVIKFRAQLRIQPPSRFTDHLPYPNPRRRPKVLQSFQANPTALLLGLFRHLLPNTPPEITSHSPSSFPSIRIDKTEIVNRSHPSLRLKLPQRRILRSERAPSLIQVNLIGLRDSELRPRGNSTTICVAHPWRRVRSPIGWKAPRGYKLTDGWVGIDDKIPPDSLECCRKGWREWRLANAAEVACYIGAVRGGQDGELVFIRFALAS